MTKFDSRLRQQCSKLYNIVVVGVLSLAPCYVRKKQVQVVDQTTHPPKCHSFVGLDRQIGSSPPANVRLLEMKKFYICSDVTTHTHTHHEKWRLASLNHAPTEFCVHCFRVSWAPFWLSVLAMCTQQRSFCAQGQEHMLHCCSLLKRLWNETHWHSNIWQLYAIITHLMVLDGSGSFLIILQQRTFI